MDEFMGVYGSLFGQMHAVAHSWLIVQKKNVIITPCDCIEVTVVIEYLYDVIVAQNVPLLFHPIPFPFRFPDLGLACNLTIKTKTSPAGPNFSFLLSNNTRSLLSTHSSLVFQIRFEYRISNLKMATIHCKSSLFPFLIFISL